MMTTTIPASAEQARGSSVHGVGGSIRQRPRNIGPSVGSSRSGEDGEGFAASDCLPVSKSYWYEKYEYIFFLTNEVHRIEYVCMQCS